MLPSTAMLPSCTAFSAAAAAASYQLALRAPLNVCYTFSLRSTWTLASASAFAANKIGKYVL